MDRKSGLALGGIIALILVVLILLIFVGWSIFNNVFGTDDSLEELSAAIESEDLAYLKDYIEVRGSSMPLTDEELGDIVSLLNDYNVQDELELYLESRENSIYLKKDKENSKYILVLKPYDVEVESNLPGTKVFLDGEEIGKLKDDETTLILKSLRPGYHIVKLLYEGEYAQLENEEDILCFDPFNDKFQLYMDLGGETVEIKSNEDQAFLYNNDENTNISLHSYYFLGPVAMDGSVTISAKAVIDGKTYESEKIDIVSNRYKYELDIDTSEDTANKDTVSVSKEKVSETIDNNTIHKIYDVIESYQYALIPAVNEGNYGYLYPYIDNGSQLMREQENLVEDLSSRGIQEELVSYNIHNIVKLSDNKYEARVTEIHDIYYPNGEVKQVTNSWTYTVVRKNGEFYLSNLRR